MRSRSCVPFTWIGAARIIGLAPFLLGLARFLPHTFLMLADRAPALLVRLLLAGGDGVDTRRCGLHRQGDDIDRRLGETAAEAESEHGAENETHGRSFKSFAGTIAPPSDRRMNVAANPV